MVDVASSSKVAMEVKTLSAKDAKATLSKKSPLPKKSLRKALLSPYETIRPVCSDSSEIEEIMRRLLVRVKRVNNWIPWSELKQMSEEQRKVLKKRRKEKHVDKSLRNQLAFGMNEVFSAMEKHALSSAVVCEDLEPAFLKNFVLDLATIHHIPILIVPKLRKITCDTLGFSCSCLGIKRGATNENSSFLPLHQKIVEQAKEFQVPDNGTLCRCPLKNPAEFHRDPDPSTVHQELGAKEVSESVLTTTHPGWPCVNRGCQSHWKVEKEKSRRAERDKETGKESGVVTSSSIGDEMMELDKGKEGSDTLPATTSGSKDCAEGPSRRKPKAHPYLRTFLSTVHHQKGKKRRNSPAPAGSEIGFEPHIQSVWERKTVLDRYKSLKLADH